MRAYLKHKLNLSLLFTILLCTFSSNTFAFDAIIDGIYYYFLDGKAHVTCYAYNSKYNKTAYSGNVVIPETITYYGQTFNVKYIDDHAFIGCTGLTGEDDVWEVKALPVLIQSRGSTINIQGTEEGTHISIYGIDGKHYGSAVAVKGRTAIKTNLQTGSIVLVKIGENAVKFRL